MLTKLDLSFNKLTHLNAHVFAGLGMLRDLDLDGNNLAQLNIVLFVELSKLTDLDLSDNKLALLNASVFDGLDALKVLDLSNNKLTQLDAEVFGGLSALTELNVKSNRVIQLDPMLLLHLTNLATLDLSRNLLTKVDGATFRKFNGKSLALFLVDNNITQVDYALKTLQEQGTLGILTMDGNPSHCSLTADTYITRDNTLVCVCASGFSYVHSRVMVLKQWAKSKSKGSFVKNWMPPSSFRQPLLR